MNRSSHMEIEGFDDTTFPCQDLLVLHVTHNDFLAQTVGSIVANWSP